jgi:hypothetical protein
LAASRQSVGRDLLRAIVKLARWRRAVFREGPLTHRREAEGILATWREVERALELAEPGSLEYERLAADAALLRDEYQRLVALAKDQERTPAGLEPVS